MLAITQFEVYVLQNGRWTLHARYPGEEREKAITDARSTENTTGFPAKVIRETYFPDVNDSERITIYASPRAKDGPQKSHDRRRTPLTATARGAAGALMPRGRRSDAGSPLTVSQTFFRVIVAGGASLVASTLTTAVAEWILRRLMEAGLDIAPATKSTLLTYAYIVMFLFFFRALFRSRMPLHRLLSGLWQNATTVSAPPVMPSNIKPHRVRPKHDRPPSPEALRELDDLKIKRGDIDQTIPPTSVSTPISAPVAPSVAVAAPPAVVTVAVPVSEAAPKIAPKIAVENDTGVTRDAQDAPDNRDEPTPDSIMLERALLRRFAIDVVKPALQRAMPDDPVTRRAAALVLAGGTEGVAATARLAAAAERELLADVLLHIGLNQAGIDSFMSQRQQLCAVPGNAELLAAGRGAFTDYLDGGASAGERLAQSFADWRTPTGCADFSTSDPAAENSDITPPHEVFMLTELREEHGDSNDQDSVDAIHDHAMGVHNEVVRAAVAAHDGREIKHTGKGIFARFPTARAAGDASIEVQTNFLESGAKLAIALIGNSAPGEDPALSPILVRRAQAIVAQTGAGEIFCEAAVQAAVGQATPGEGNKASADVHGAGQYIVRLSMPEPEFESAVPPAGTDTPRLFPGTHAVRE